MYTALSKAYICLLTLLLSVSAPSSVPTSAKSNIKTSQDAMRSILPTSLPDVYSAEGGSADQQRKEALVEELAEYWIGGFGNRECCITHKQSP